MLTQSEEDRSIVTADELPYLRGRKLNWYGHPKQVPGGRMQMHGVEKPRYQVKRPLLVVGTGRCGTTWLSKTLLAAGYDIPHECMGRHGTVSMFFHSDHDWYPFIPWATDHKGRKAHIGERRSDFRFNSVMHLVRHPLQVEASMRSILTRLEMFWAQDVGVLSVPFDLRPAKLRNLFYWRDVVAHCERVADYTVPLQQMVEVPYRWQRLLAEAELPIVPMPKLPATNKSSGFKKHDPMDWSEVDTMDASLGKELRRMCRRLGLE